MYGIANGIEIKNSTKLRCPNCNSVFAIKNEIEILYRNISILYFNLKDKKAEAKCRQCKHTVQIDLSGDQMQIQK
jgi:hypothetical protein